MFYDDRSRGLNNTYIDNNEKKYGCKIQMINDMESCSKILGIFSDYNKELKIKTLKH